MGREIIKTVKRSSFTKNVPEIEIGIGDDDFWFIFSVALNSNVCPERYRL
jgi:hypothetical protein